MSIDFKPPEQTVANATPLELPTAPLGGDVSELSPALSPALSPTLAAAEIQPDAAAATTTKEYVDRDRTGKAELLLDVMNESKDILTQNGVSEDDDNVLASLMMNEGGRNGRRSTLGRHFKRQAGALDELLQQQNLDPQTLASDPQAREELEKKLPEDQRFLLDRVISGEIQLNDLDNPAQMAKLTEAGIDKRVEQYQEMERLKQQQQENGELGEEDAARLSELETMNGRAVGFDNADVGPDSKFGDLSGLSEARFREIYAEGQQRFEPHIYRKARANFDAQAEDYLAGDMEDPLRVKAGGVGTGNLSETDVTTMQDAGNHDLLADWATSYGTSQIMGLYAHNGDLKAKDGAGEDVSYDLAELKGSMNRLSPNSEDVNMQIAFLNMKAGYDSTKLGNSLSDVDSLIQLYNGAKPGTANHTGYRDRLVPNKDEYDRVKQEREAAEPQPSPLEHFAD
jgi:hypothetical protein